MEFGAWIHGYEDIPLEQQVAQAAQMGLQSVRAYSLEYARRISPALAKNGMTLLGGIHIDPQALMMDWHSQFFPDVLEAYHGLGVPLEGICIGNELREFGDEPDKKRFTPGLASELANVILLSRNWLNEHGFQTPLTYAMEEIVYDPALTFYDFMQPLLNACDIISINAYPMGREAWFTYGAFDESRRFLTDSRTRNDRLAAFEYRLRKVLAQLESMNKPAMLSETGFPSAVGYHIDGEIQGKPRVIPDSDNIRYGEVMADFIHRLSQINADYQGRIKAVYFYEWRDNLYHDKIWNVENSPIHTAFGLCDRFGKPKFDIKNSLTTLK